MFAWPLLQLKHNNVFSGYCWTTRHFQQHKNTESCIKMLLWRIYVAGNNKMHTGLHVTCPTLSSNLNQIWIFSTDFHRSPHYQISRISVQSYLRTDGQTDGHDEANKHFSLLMWTLLETMYLNVHISSLKCRRGSSRRSLNILTVLSCVGIPL
jgi:hypothetical protein